MILGILPALIILTSGIYFFMPVFAWGFFGWVFLLGLTSIPIFIGLGTNRDEERLVPMLGMLVGGIIASVIAVALVTSLPILRNQAYRELIGQVKEDKEHHGLPPIDVNNAPLVSEHMAYQIAQKKLSDIPALGSQVVLGHLTKQNIKGKLYWVSYLEHSGFFKWNNTGSTPGYIKVSASDVDDVTFVREIKGEPLKMKYLESAYFGSNADRRLYMDVTKTKGIIDLSPEVDDEGRPFLVASLYSKKVGFNGEDTDGVVVLDVQTGKTQVYDLENVPAWIDRVHPQSFVAEQIHDWGEYVNGWFNPSDQGKLTISDNIDLVYGEDGNCYFYVGIASVGRDNGIVGFMLINSRTKKSTLFYISGASEYVAGESAVNVMKEKGYHYTNPLPFNVNGVPTYIMTLTDNNGLARAYGMVDIQNYQVMAVGDTLKSTYQMFLNKLARHGSDVDIDNKADMATEVTGEVSRVASEIKSGNTIYYVILNGQTVIFTSSSDISEKLVLTKAGDRVRVRFEKTEGKLATMLAFENLDIK